MASVSSRSLYSSAAYYPPADSLYPGSYAPLLPGDGSAAGVYPYPAYHHPPHYQQAVYYPPPAPGGYYQPPPPPAHQNFNINVNLISSPLPPPLPTVQQTGGLTYHIDQQQMQQYYLQQNHQQPQQQPQQSTATATKLPSSSSSSSSLKKRGRRRLIVARRKAVIHTCAFGSCGKTYAKSSHLKACSERARLS